MPSHEEVAMNQTQSNAGQKPQGDAKKTVEEVWGTININKFHEEDMNRIISAALGHRIAESVQQELVRLVRLVQRVTYEGELLSNKRNAEVWINEEKSQPVQTNLSNTDDGATKGKAKPTSGSTDRRYIDQCLSWAGLTIMALLKPDPEIVLARGLMTTIETVMLKQSRWLGGIVGFFARNQLIPFVIGLFVNIGVVIVACLFWWFVGDISDESQVYQKHYQYAIWTTGAAFVGGIVSLIMRLPSTTALQDQNVLIIFLTAFFKPWVAVIFGFVVFMIMRSEGVHLMNPDVLANPHFWGVIGFISGWSERFAPDIITRAAERVRSGTEDPRPGFAEAAERPRETPPAQNPPQQSPRSGESTTAGSRGETTDARS
jgi:hypothetical protein